MRLYYNQSVFVRTKELAGRTDEVAQSGIELIGDGSMAADIQVITLACRAMQSTVPGFKIELGHAGYFGAVLRNLNVKPAVKAEICHLIEQKNFAALGDLLDTLEDCRDRVLRRLPRLFGGRRCWTKHGNCIPRAAQTPPCSILKHCTTRQCRRFAGAGAAGFGHC